MRNEPIIAKFEKNEWQKNYEIEQKVRDMIPYARVHIDNGSMQILKPNGVLLRVFQNGYVRKWRNWQWTKSSSMSKATRPKTLEDAIAFAAKYNG